MKRLSAKFPKSSAAKPTEIANPESSFNPPTHKIPTSKVSDLVEGFFLSANGFAFGQVVPDCDDDCCAKFGNQIMQIDNGDEKPHAKLIEHETNRARREENHGLTRRLFFRAFEDVDDAKPVVEDNRHAERNRRRVKIIHAGELSQREKDSIVEHERYAADKTEADNFQKSFASHLIDLNSEKFIAEIFFSASRFKI